MGPGVSAVSLVSPKFRSYKRQCLKQVDHLEGSALSLVLYGRAWPAFSHTLIQPTTSRSAEGHGKNLTHLPAVQTYIKNWHSRPLYPGASMKTTAKIDHRCQVNQERTECCYGDVMPPVIQGHHVFDIRNNFFIKLDANHKASLVVPSVSKMNSQHESWETEGCIKLY